MVVEYDAPASVELCSAGRVHATTSCVEYTVPVPDAIVVPTPAWCATTAPAAEYISQGVAQVWRSASLNVCRGLDASTIRMRSVSVSGGVVARSVPTPL